MLALSLNAYSAWMHFLTKYLSKVNAESQPCACGLRGLLLTSMHFQSACVITKHLSRFNADPQPLLWLEGFLLALVRTELGCSIA